MTVEDLKELGVLAVGHRRKILSAIEELSKSQAAPTKASDPTPAAGAAERRQLTVMFCDLVGSTALSSRLDPEDMGALLRAVHGAIGAAAARYDGHVAKLMGDGAMLYFGYPRAHEDDAERAVRAGLAIVEAIQVLGRERSLDLETRVGIATGLVVVGELMGQGEARERGVVGDTPNLAARLQAIAMPGHLVVSAATRRLLGKVFHLIDLGLQQIKGFSDPVGAWSVDRASDIINRFESSRTEAMTPFVGREQEVSLLIDRWKDAVDGEGQVVLLSGEAGIGKSRTLAALQDRIESDGPIISRFQCSPHHLNEAFYPLIGQIWQEAGFLAGEPAAARIDKLEAMVEHSNLQNVDTVPYLASLLSISGDGRYPPLEMGPGDLRERIIAALLGLLAAPSRKAPVLMLLEDAHWIDPTTMDLFDRLIDRVQQLRVLLVVTFPARIFGALARPLPCYGPWAESSRAPPSLGHD